MKIELILPDNTRSVDVLYTIPADNCDGGFGFTISTKRIWEPKDGEAYTVEECK